MTDDELNMWQHIDEATDRIQQLEKKVEDMQDAWIVFMKLMAKHLEDEHGE